MKKNLMLAVVMMLSTTIYAQHRKGSGGHHDQTETMKTELLLNDNQTATIKGINKTYADQYHTLRRDTLQTREQKHITVKALREKQRKEITAVLTPEQADKWKAYKKDQAAKRKEEHKKAREQYRSDMKIALSLTDDQATQMDKAAKQFRKDVHAAKKNGSTDKAGIKKIRDEHVATVKNILSEDQFQKWLTFRQEHNTHKKGNHGRKK